MAAEVLPLFDARLKGQEDWPTRCVALADAVRQLGLSALACHPILEAARTAADLEGSKQVQQHHVLEAIQYRSLDRSSF